MAGRSSVCASARGVGGDGRSGRIVALKPPGLRRSATTESRTSTCREQAAELAQRKYTNQKRRHKTAPPPPPPHPPFSSLNRKKKENNNRRRPRIASDVAKLKLNMKARA